MVELLESGDKPGLKGQVVDINPVYTTLHESGNAESGSSLQLPNSLFFQRALRRWHGAAASETMEPARNAATPQDVNPPARLP